jgi:hypothetical protein
MTMRAVEVFQIQDHVLSAIVADKQYEALAPP